MEFYFKTYFLHWNPKPYISLPCCGPTAVAGLAAPDYVMEFGRISYHQILSKNVISIKVDQKSRTMRSFIQ